LPVSSANAALEISVEILKIIPIFFNINISFLNKSKLMLKVEEDNSKCINGQRFALTDIGITQYKLFSIIFITIVN
jgi:hypothetical protein